MNDLSYEDFERYSGIQVWMRRVCTSCFGADKGPSDECEMCKGSGHEPADWMSLYRLLRYAKMIQESRHWEH